MENLNKHIVVVILFCLGFLLMPNQGYACSKTTTKTEQSSCSTKKDKNLKEKNCCKTKSCKESKEDTGHCNGDCKDKTCTNNTPSPSLALFSHLQINELHFADVKKQKFCFKQVYYSSNYSTIWQPPKIS